MKLKKRNKINTIRTFALGLIFIGFLFMYVGIFFRDSMWLVTFFMVLGLLSITISTFIYFWIGMLSTKSVQVVCPSCQKATKILGRVDICMHCNQPITSDKSLDGKEFDSKYNKKRR